MAGPALILSSELSRQPHSGLFGSSGSAILKDDDGEDPGEHCGVTGSI